MGAVALGAVRALHAGPAAGLVARLAVLGLKLGLLGFEVSLHGSLLLVVKLAVLVCVELFEQLLVHVTLGAVGTVALGGAGLVAGRLGSVLSENGKGGDGESNKDVFRHVFYGCGVERGSELTLPPFACYTPVANRSCNFFQDALRAS